MLNSLSIIPILRYVVLTFGCVLGIVSRWFSWVPGYYTMCVWNPREYLSKKLAPRLQYTIGKSPHFKNSVLDSGLFMLANQPATQQGFVPFVQHDWLTEERLANKGMQWAYFASQEQKNQPSRGTLVVNFHARTSSVASSSLGNDSPKQIIEVFCSIAKRWQHAADRRDLFSWGLEFKVQPE